MSNSKAKTNYTAPTEKFLAGLEQQELRDLSVAVIEQFGGESEFLETFDAVTQYSMGVGYDGFNHEEELLAFYDANKSDVLAVTKLAAVEMGFDTVINLARNFIGSKDFDIDDISAGMHEVVGKDEQSSENRIQVCSWLVWAVGEDVCRKYSDFKDTQSMRVKAV